MSLRQQKIVFLVEERNNPSTDYFVYPALTFNGYKIIRYDFLTIPHPDELENSIVIFIRYIPTSWAKLIDANRKRLSGLIFFMDDDVLDVSSTAGMSWLYRYKLAKFSACHINWLRSQGVEIWVSTPYLQQKYASWQPKLVLPTPVAATQNHIRLFYHGSPATHKPEIAWLHPVIKEVLGNNDKISFEIIGGANVHRLYRNLPRVNIIHPMKWSSYQAFISTPGRQIGLVPQLDLPFNRARSYTKFFDIHRCGAVGIFSPNSACAEIIDHNVDGLIVDLNREAWVEAILKLANDQALCEFMRNNAEIKIADLIIKAQNTYLGLFSK